MYTIENETLRIVINPLGAELSSLFNKSTGLEYIWSGDPVFWGKKSPVLFPIVGGLKDNRYFVDDKSYELNRHGFAREKMFRIVNQRPNTLQFQLQSDAHTLQVFPFHFDFSVIYTLDSGSLSVTYQVKNTGDELMHFSVGGHPAFQLPLTDELTYEDYYLVFNKKELAGNWPISKDGLIERAPLPLLNQSQEIRLSKSLFYKDALVFKGLESDEVQVKSELHPAGLSVSFKGFPYLGIWAAKGANFICIEPWCGIADGVDSSQVLAEKEGIVHLAADDIFERTWTVSTW